MNQAQTAERFSDDEPRRADQLPMSALASQIKAEIDAAVTTAKMFPRSLTTFLQRAESMACVSVEVAEACEYTLPRKKQNGEKIQGPTVRLAEIVASQYGNLRIGSRITEINQTEVVAQGVAHDLETNVMWTAEVRRSIVGRNGRYSQDMIVMTCNAASAVASRNAVFKAIPMAIVGPIAEKAKQVALGTAETLKTRRDKLLGWFTAKGIGKDRIFAGLEVNGEEDINLEKFQELNGLWNSVREGEVTAEEAFPIVQGNRFSTDQTQTMPPKDKQTTEAKGKP